MKKIILILLFMCSWALADYTFEVENSTMVDAYYNIFNAIAALFQSQDYIDLLRLVFLLGGFFVFLGVIMNASNGVNSKTLMPYFKYLGFGVVILTIIFSSKETVWITSKTLPSFCSTSSPNVGFAVELPSVLGFGFTTINKIGSNLTEMAETAFTAPNISGTSSMSDSDGYLGSLKQTIKVLSLDPEKISGKSANGVKAVSFTSLIENHFATCVYNIAQNKTQGKDKLAEMNDSRNLYKWTKDFLDFTFDGSNMKTGEALITKDGSTISCREHFLFLDEAVNSLKEKYSCMLPLAHGGVLELLTGTTSGTESKMTEIIVQSGLISALETSRKANSIGVSGATYASGKTRAEFTQTQMASGAYMAEMLPYIQMTMRAVLYGFFPFVFVIILLPGGLKVLIQYGQTMLWIELWGPTAAVINMFVNLKAKEQLSTLYDESGLSMMTSIDMLTESSTIAGYGAYLYMSVPALTWLILKGSGHMLGNITGSISAGYSANLKSEGIAKDVAMQKASASTGKSVTSLINSIEGSQVANKVSDARGFDAIGMQKTIAAKTTTNKAQRQAEIEKIAAQGGDKDFIKTQVKKAGYDATAEQSDVQAKTDSGGKQVVADNSYVKTSTELETTKKEINSAGSKKAVVSNKSDMNNKSFNKDLEVNQNTSVKDYKNLGKQEVAETKSTSSNIDKNGQEKIQSNLTNKKNEETIKDFTRYSEIDNKDNFFKKQSQNDFRTKEKVDLLKGDSNGDGKISEKEINRLASINDASSKSQVLAEDVKQKALIQEGKKLNSSNSIEAKKAQKIANSQGGLNKDLAAAAVAFNSGAGAKVDTFNKRKDIKSVENFEGAGVEAEDISSQESSSKMKDIAKAKVEAKSLEQDIQGIDTEAKEQISKLKEKGLNHIDASKAVLANMAKEGYVSSELTAETLGSEIGEIQKEKEKALSKIGVSAKSVEKQEEAVERLNDLSNNDSFNKEQKQGFKDSANQLNESISSYKETSQKFDTKMANKVGEYQNAGLVKVDKKGDIKFLDTKRQLEDSSEDQKMMILQKIKGSSQGRTTEMNDLDGMESKKVKSLTGNNTTDIKKAVNEWTKTGNYNYDLGYRAVNAGVDRETLANINTGVSAVKSTIGAVGVGKFIAGK